MYPLLDRFWSVYFLLREAGTFVWRNRNTKKKSKSMGHHASTQDTFRK